MSYTKEMAQAEANLKKAMQQWNITQRENPATGNGMFIDSDTRQNGSIVPTRMEYIRTGNGLEVTRIVQGNQLIYGTDANGVCHDLQMVFEEFLAVQPQMEAVITTFPTPISISFGGRCAASTSNTRR